MYIEQLKIKKWALCEDDCSIIKTFNSKSAATKYYNEIRRPIYEITQQNSRNN